MIYSPISLERHNALAPGPMRSGKREGFTLLELLIVVAIIAILAAIAVPNFLEAQTRSKVARVRADFRTIATALEAYAVDNNDYPRNWNPKDNIIKNILSPDLSTPVAYLTTKNIHDPFGKIVHFYGNLKVYQYHRIVPFLESLYMDSPWLPAYEARHSDHYTPCLANPHAFQKYGQWRLQSIGPDGSGGGPPPNTDTSITPWDLHDTLYDPTNGTKSFGDIVRTQLHPEGKIQFRSP